LRFFFQYFRLHGHDGALVRSQARILEVEEGEATADEAARLLLAPGAWVVRLHRLRNVAGKPIMIDRLVLAADRVPDFPRPPAEVPELLYIHLLERYGIRISAVREHVTAELVDEADAKLLELVRPCAVLVIDEVAFDQAGAPTILARHRASTAQHCYINEVR
jgi:GntR family transcriptional regulator